MKRLRNIRNQRGQAAIEFIVVVVVVFFFLLFYLSLTFVLVTSDYIDYATFMAARSYKSGFGQRSEQEKYAKQTFDEYITRVDTLVRGTRLDFVEAIPGDRNTGGVVSTYTMDLFYLPPFFLNPAASSRITLSSEAHLGRDPTNSECRSFFDTFSQQFGLGIEGTGYVDQMEDNAC